MKDSHFIICLLLESMAGGASLQYSLTFICSVVLCWSPDSFIMMLFNNVFFFILRVKRPVRYTLDRDEDMRSSGTRSAFIGKYKVGCTKEGRILGLDLTLAVNSGNTIDLSAAVSLLLISSKRVVFFIPLGYFWVVGSACLQHNRG